jgi:hypothetical protein
LRACLIRDAADSLAPLSPEIQGAAGVAERSGDGDRGGGERDNARRHFRQCSCISYCFRAMLSTFRKKNGHADALQQSGQNPEVAATPSAIAHLGGGRPAV